MKKLQFLLLVTILLLTSCKSTVIVETPEMSTFQIMQQLSENTYNNDGSWSSDNDYRMVLRNSYWRADVYSELRERNVIFSERAKEVYTYLIHVQNEGGEGVFGIPADVLNPEFGDVIKFVIENYPKSIQNGWIVSLPGDDIGELYYDHGNALVSLAKGYIHYENMEYLNAVVKGADWALDKPLNQNVNYLSSLSKGLSYAYMISGDIRYLERSIYLHQEGIFPNISLETGASLDSHNQKLEYHGFILSGIIALKSAISDTLEVSSQIDRYLNIAVNHMKVRDLSEKGEYGETWPGINLLVWFELEQLRNLSSEEKEARDRCIALINSYRDHIEIEEGFRLQKSIYSNFFVGLYDYQ